MLIYVFPGQGSQTRGMGSALFGEFPEQTRLANRILGYSIEALCLEDPYQQLSKTEFTQPALFVVSALTYLKKKKDGATPPGCLAGHSVGEYAALFASGAIDFETGLRLVQRRGQLMSQAREGGMAAVLGLPAEEVRSILDSNHLSEITVANFNSR